MQRMTERSVYLPLRITFGLVPIVAGLDKFTNLLTNWQAYVSPLAEKLIPVPASVLMPVVGVVEIAVGAMLLTRWTRLGAYVASGWLTLIAINLASMGSFDVAVRDLVMAVAAFALGGLEAERVRSAYRMSLPVAPQERTA
jgi:uncharacterized membrane protein YphA (DoxX/SURF4 family)